MQKALLILLQVFFYPPLKEEAKFDVIFAEEYKSALHYIQKNNTSIKKSAIAYHHNPELLATIVFPELMRYSSISDFLETSALESVYIRYGSTAADFSIGHFQMKPSFAEQLEVEIEQSDSLKKVYAVVINYTTTAEIARRTKRLQRLQSVQWQLIYLNAFVSVVQEKFKTESFNSKEDSLRFYASAYNSGFAKPPSQIKQAATSCYFPYGMRYSGKQYAYTEVALYFHAHTFSPKNPSKVPL